jgi:DNA-binding CsgD family transcriptional regulator
MTSPTRDIVPLDELTQRERQVLDLIARGKTNVEIAQEMDIAYYTARNHVSNVLSKLGVETREQAATWWRITGSTMPPPRRRSRVHAWARAIVGLGSLKMAATALGALAVIAVATGLVVLTILSLPGGETENVETEPGQATVPADDEATPQPDNEGGGASTPAASATATTSETPRATPQATGETIAGMPVYEFTEGEPVGLAGRAAIVETGCWQCDGETDALVRLYEDPTGAIRRETLFEAPDDGQSFISRYDVSPDMSHIVVAVCDSAYCAGIGPPTGEATTTIFESRDGGVSWAQIATFEEPTWMDILSDGTLIASQVDPVDFTANSFAWPSMEPLPEPAATVLSERVATADGGWVWLASDNRTLIRADGSTFWRLDDESYVIARAEAIPGVGLRLQLAPATVGESSSMPASYTAILRGQELAGIYETGEERDDVQELLQVQGWAGDQLATGNETFGNSDPTFIDFATGTYHRLEGPFLPGSGSEAALPDGRNWLVDAIEGPFARVTSGEECLNVREAAGQDAAILGCFADGVLFRHDGETQEAGGTAWLHVTTPDGRAGWASTEFLEY